MRNSRPFKMAFTASLVALLVPLQGFAADKDASSSDSDKVDLKKLEEKYWAAKDTDYSVIQNRAYPKDKRFFVSLGYGPLMNDPYSTGRMTNIALGYYFSERFGVEFAYEKGDLSDNDGVTKYRDTYGVQVDYNRFVESKTLLGVLVPLYAKMSFFDMAILYFDMQFAAGIGQVTYDMRQNIGDDRGSTTHFEFDITQQVFFHKHFALRFDIKNKWYNQERRRYQLTGGQTEADRGLGSSRTQDTTVLFGGTYFFP